MSEPLSVSPRVIDLICSRICHDLISPVSAISNGIELISEMGEGVDGEAFGLIADSATVVSSRLAVMRYAFGAASPGLDEVREVAQAYFADSKITLDWPKGNGLSMDMTSRQAFPKVILNVVLVLAESIGASGKITLANADGGIAVTAEPRTGNIRSDILAGLENISPDNLDARTIQAYVTGMLAKRFGYTLDRSVQTSQIVFTLR